MGKRRGVTNKNRFGWKEGSIRSDHDWMSALLWTYYMTPEGPFLHLSLYKVTVQGNLCPKASDLVPCRLSSPRESYHGSNRIYGNRIEFSIKFHRIPENSIEFSMESQPAVPGVWDVPNEGRNTAWYKIRF